MWREVKAADWDEVEAAHAQGWNVHHFWYEPWHPTGAVVRIENAPDHAGDPWDASPDEQLYGEDWPLVHDFFAATSRLAVFGEGDHLLKVTHCHLNAHGLDVDDEVWFALKFAWNRIRVMLKYDRRRMLGKWFG